MFARTGAPARCGHREAAVIENYNNCIARRKSQRLPREEAARGVERAARVTNEYSKKNATAEVPHRAQFSFLLYILFRKH